MSITLPEFQEFINKNDGVLIFKFGAEWCGPCKQIEKQVLSGFGKMPPNVRCMIIDTDASQDVFRFLKTKRIATGIPAILAYYRENKHFFPDEFVIGASPTEINELFRKCYHKSLEYTHYTDQKEK
jgi:thiol-disulfide isomerase/thioredoxin